MYLTFPNIYIFTVILVPKPLRIFFFFGRISVLSVLQEGETKKANFSRKKAFGHVNMPCKMVSEIERVNNKGNYKPVYFKWPNLVK